MHGSSRYYHYNTGGNILTETASNQNVLVRYMRDNSGKAISMLQGTNTYYFIYNAHGDVTSLTDSTGTTVATYAYDEFGNIINSTGTVYSPLRYAAAHNSYWESETSLYKMGARYYNAEVGRWLTRDKFNGYKTETQTKNKYIYTGNNPITNVDPSGFSYARFDGKRIILRRKRFIYWGPYFTVTSANAKTGNPYKYGWAENNGPIPQRTFWLKAINIRPGGGSWGPVRIRLEPNVLYFGKTKRDGFHLHSGPWRYSIGCIRTYTTTVAIFVNELLSVDRSFPLYVNYKKYPEFKKYR